LVSGLSREDDPSLIFHLKNRYDAISFNIKIYETVLVNLVMSPSLCNRLIEKTRETKWVCGPVVDNVKLGVSSGANSNSSRTNVGYRDIDPECREHRSVICMAEGKWPTLDLEAGSVK